ncbi:MAG TPA: isochorismatase family cysteine hydrolase [Pyrinomonadaceae bacterium]|jgi:nicotinamidase-related amidase|nr:isochorismatase family cysteine hydrolase [Pyrinomonadaceae bacterium]
MPIRSHDLHGSAPDKSNAALLLIDVINDFDFPEAEQLLRLALPAAKNIAALKRRAKDAGIPVIYVNDNFGRWRSDFKKIVAHCRDESRGKPIVELLLPDEDDYFVLKPKNSGFYSTTLDLLLIHLGARNLIITGIQGNNCVLFTANDAYERDYKIFVPSDCTASNTEEQNEHALKQMQTVLKADVSNAKELDLKAITS